MATIGKDAAGAEAGTDLQAIVSDIASLKHDLAALAGHLKTGVSAAAADGARSAAGQIGEEATHVYQTLEAQGERSATAITHYVKEQPAMSLLIAFAAGFLGSRLLSR